MRRVDIHQFGGPEVLEIGEADIPTPGPGQVSVELVSSGINPVDVKMRDGSSKWVSGFSDFPFSPGREGYGTVLAVGEDVTDFTVGQKVFGIAAMDAECGVHAEVALFPAYRLAPAPDGVDPLLLGAVPLASMTAWTSVHRIAKVTADDRVLIHGAGGGVGDWLVQFCLATGATVFGSASTRHAERITSLGAQHVDYTAGDVFAHMGTRPTVVFDGVYFTTFQESLKHLAPGGRIVVLPSLADLTPAHEAGIEAHIATIVPDREALSNIGQGLADGRLSSRISRVFAMSELAEAHRILETGHAPGKMVLDMRQ